MSTDSTIVLITGANSGIGLISAQIVAAASEKYHVIIAARSSEKADAAEKDVKSYGIKGTVSTIVLDVTDQNSINDAVAKIEERFGRLDVLVNNAGIISRDPDFTKAAMETYHVNGIAPATVSMAFRKLLLKSKNPYSIYVSSGVGSISIATDKNHPYYNPLDFHYRMSKAALNMWVVQEHKVMAKKGLKVFPICPGFVVSNLRGTDEAARTGGGYAGDPAESGRLILSIIQGKRDADAGVFVHKDGIYPW